MDTPATGLGPYLIRCRERRGWTLTEAAAHIDMSKSHLSQLEGGKIGLPNAALRRRIAEAYGVRHADILVAAGELTPEEIAPLPATHIADPLLADLVNQWPSLDPHLKRFLKDELATVDPVVRRAQAG